MTSRVGAPDESWTLTPEDHALAMSKHPEPRNTSMRTASRAIVGVSAGAGSSSASMATNDVWRRPRPLPTPDRCVMRCTPCSVCQRWPGRGCTRSVALRVPASVCSAWSSVTDGDTLRIGSERIRLHGIDAPESAQSCRAGGETWVCGAAASRAHPMRFARRPVTHAAADSVTGAIPHGIHRFFVAFVAANPLHAQSLAIMESAAEPVLD